MPEQHQKSVLENNVRVLSERMDGVRSVSVGVLVDAGSKDEQPAERGYAHLLEHMLFQGTDDRDAQAIAEMMEIGGGAIGAFTTREYTVYHATVLDEYLPFALEALGDMLANSVLPETALERQRGVILNEIAGHDDPTKQVNDLLKQTMWPGHPMGYPTTGTRQSLEGATQESLLRFMRRHYAANRIVLVAAGNVDHDTFASQAQDMFWALEQVETPPDLSAPTFNSGAVVASLRDLQQVYFSLSWPAPPYTSLDRYTWHVFSALFGGGSTSRLFRNLREERGLVYHIASQYQAYGSTGALVVEGATLPQTLIPVLAGVLIELWKMAQDDVNPDDHHRTVQSMISQHLVSGDSAYVRMSRLALQEYYFQRVVSSDEVVRALRLQTPEAIRQIASTLCDGGLPTLSLVGPVSAELLEAVGSMLGEFGGEVSVSFSKNGRQGVHHPAFEQAVNEAL